MIHVVKAMKGVEEVSVQSIVAGQGLIISEDRDIMVIMAELYNIHFRFLLHRWTRHVAGSGSGGSSRGLLKVV